jgi:hypothetical protein
LAGSPIIVDIFAIFRADRSSHYTERFALAADVGATILNESRRNFRAILGVLGARTGSAEALRALQAALDKALLPMRDQLPEYPVPLVFASTGPAYDPNDPTVRDRLTRLNELGARYAENTARMKAFGAASVQYIRLLDGTQRALETVVIALDAPVDLTKVVEGLLPIAFAVRRELEVAQAARAAR